ncbi:hypothetical protein VCRA2119O147_1040018 [Vibrio crassostreae]|nr:hypothetical protein VCRA2119O44_140052 [Vibrio crassostreae]CAK1764225.1 hypothetical protein VCRA2119O47_140086 [Vibrio crassostreae]CAK1791805.1 hypothetical protein VCRA2116O28_160045 [Vibrio crassostreae]CAK1805274.1 hypothetical protein VCRA2116O27_170052 [Vibrio crassostreae]CAK1807153.1 hypothetical protein VCRA2117O38_170051 [Vibrio crassostreae]
MVSLHSKRPISCIHIQNLHTTISLRIAPINLLPFSGGGFADLSATKTFVPIKF